MIQHFMAQGSDYLTAKTQALTAIHGMISKQAMILTYNDIFYLISIFFAICIPLLAIFISRKKKDRAAPVDLAAME